VVAHMDKPSELAFSDRLSNHPLTLSVVNKNIDRVGALHAAFRSTHREEFIVRSAVDQHADPAGGNIRIAVFVDGHLKADPLGKIAQQSIAAVQEFERFFGTISKLGDRAVELRD